jgi:hypothetical protein
MVSVPVPGHVRAVSRSVIGHVPETAIRRQSPLSQMSLSCPSRLTKPPAEWGVTGRPQTTHLPSAPPTASPSRSRALIARSSVCPSSDTLMHLPNVPTNCSLPRGSGVIPAGNVETDSIGEAVSGCSPSRGRRARAERAVVQGRDALLARSLDVSLEGKRGQCAVALGIARQGFELYRGLRREAAADPLGITGTILLRSLAEAAILVRWIEGDPPLRVDMYFAEDDRQRLADAEPFRQFRARRGRPNEPVYSAEQIAEMQANMATVRARAVAAGEPIGEKRGSLLPPIEVMAQKTGDSAVWEAYEVIYRVTSPWTHTAGMALGSHRMEQRPDGPHLVIGGPYRDLHLRAMASPLMAHLVGSTSRICGLGLEDEARVWQDAVVSWPTPMDE